MRSDSEGSAREHASPRFPSLVDRLNFHSTGLRAPSGANDGREQRRGDSVASAVKELGKENARGSSRSIPSTTSGAKSPSLFIPSPRSAPTFTKGKARASEGGHLNALPTRSTPAARKRDTIITLDSSSVSSDDELPAFVASSSRSAAASGLDSRSSHLPTPRKPASGPRATASRPTSSDVAASSSSSSPSLASWLKIPGPSARPVQKNLQLGKKRAVDVIEILDTQDDVEPTRAASPVPHTPRTVSSSATIAAPPSSADFWESISASEFERLEEPRRPSSNMPPQRRAGTPLSSKNNKRRVPNPASASTSTSTGARGRALSFTDDTDDIVSVSVSGGPSPLRSTSAQSRPHISSNHHQHHPNTHEELLPDPDLEDAFLSFYDDDDDALAMIEEQAMASASTSIRIRSGASSGPIAPPHHTPLSALPEDKRRKYLDQFGNPDDDDDDPPPSGPGYHNSTSGSGRGGAGGARGRQAGRRAGGDYDDNEEGYGGNWADERGSGGNQSGSGSGSRFTGRKTGAGSSSGGAYKARGGSGFRRPYRGWARGRGRGGSGSSRGGR
ncbi:unnamed protein product [Tilletia controversa]|uniref:Uncharacterized protein n=1 Tax=Tilletia controversa TaxID=13291 RepID=A0A8X7MLC0_9BASI|nr:hypothetical protein CF328_g6562 [Tilletia controversa]KAE8240998.1 hypothetical protein A4X06_0g7698 [Tilletia controversa]CAD6926083.1 unnamed protein product [Tilletia controversa]CAD6979642.1 unnamed protein product [Tilletia controversa]